jgi:hypothetical protein
MFFLFTHVDIGCEANCEWNAFLHVDWAKGTFKYVLVCTHARKHACTQAHMHASTHARMQASTSEHVYARTSQFFEVDK